jgi:ABC-type transport system involved in Fe-S cluster assembly fused permease/ATPase subunit
MRRARATFIMAHRLSTEWPADRIPVFRNGRIVEEGGLNALLARGGLFTALAGAQGFEVPQAG